MRVLVGCEYSGRALCVRRIVALSRITMLRGADEYD